jgi:hypothetical protein
MIVEEGAAPRLVRLLAGHSAEQLAPPAVSRRPRRA